MSRLAATWLTSNFVLPRPVDAIERDLSNGYLLIVVLHQLGCLQPEELEQASDDDYPDVVLNNFRILTKALRNLNLRLTRKDVAGIVSEQAGSSADLVMLIKRAKESVLGGKMSKEAKEYAFRESIRTLRPKTFVRTQQKFDELSNEDKFHYDAQNVLDSGVFAEIDNRCMLGRYETFKYDVDTKIARQEEHAQQLYMTKRDLVHTQIFDHRQKVIQDNALRTQTQKEKWSQTQQDKKNRQIRDLQFELATGKIEQLKRERRSNEHRAEQISGFDAFEVSMKRSGLGGNDDDGQPLGTTYEDPEIFLVRIEEAARKKWPTKEDASDFMNQLKIRTKDKRLARYEKARRRRRMLVDQAAAAALSASNSLAALNDTSANTQSALLAETMARDKQRAKQEKYEDMLAKGKTSLEVSQNLAEEKIRVFAEQFRMMADEQKDDRKAELEGIIEARAARKEERRRQNAVVVRSIVTDMVSDLFDGGGGGGGGKSKQQQQSEKSCKLSNTTESALLSTQLMDMSRTIIEVGEEESSSQLKELTGLDAWPAIVALTLNVGRWTIETPPEIVPVSLAQSESIKEAEKGLEERNSTENADAVAAATTAAKEDDVPVENVKQAPFARKIESFGETSQSVMEALIAKSCSKGGSDVSLDVKMGEVPVFDANEQVNKIIVVLSDGCSIPQTVFLRSLGWLGKGCLWDASMAIEAAITMQPLLEGKTPSITFASLVTIFGKGSVACPAELTTTTLPPTVLRTATEMVEAASRVMGTLAAVEAGTFTLANAPFTSTTCGILIGQSLWMRAFVKDKLASQANSSSLDGLVIVSRNFSGKHATADGPVFAKVIDWFLRGGTRDNVREVDVDLQEAIGNEMGAGGGGGKGGKKPPAKAKGKGGDEEISEISALGAIVWVRRQDGLDSSLVVDPLDISTEGPGGPASKILDAFSLLVPPASVATISKIEEEDLLTFSAKQNAVSIYCLQQKDTRMLSSLLLGKPEAFTAVAVEDGEEAVHVEPTQPLAPKEECPIVSCLTYSSPLAASEAILSFALDSLGFVAVEEALEVPVEEAVETAEGEEASADPALSRIAKVHKRVSTIIAQRRNLLSPEDKLWLLHSNGDFPLDINAVYAAHTTLCDAQAQMLELNGALILALVHLFASIEQKIRARETSMLKSLKTTDPRWRELCLQVQTLLGGIPSNNPSAAEDTKVLTGDLVCRLGDVIDDRHMSWLNMFSKLEDDASNGFVDTEAMLRKLTNLMGEAAFKILDKQRMSALAVAELLEKASYTEFPWQMQNSGTRGSSRLLLERRRDEARMAVTTLFGDSTRFEDSFVEEEEDFSSVWKQLAAVELPSAAIMSPMCVSVITEVYLEVLGTSISTLIAIACGLDELKAASTSSFERMSRDILRRHEYEHLILTTWAGDMKQAGAEPIKFLQQFYFDVSNDPLLDSVQCMSGQNLHEMRDMCLSLPVLARLSQEIYQLQQAQAVEALEQLAEGSPSAESTEGQGQEQATTRNNNGNNCTKEQDPHFFVQNTSACIISVIKKLAKTEAQISIGWRNAKRITHLVERVLFVDKQGQGGKHFWSLLMTSLVYAAVPCACSSEYILRLANVLVRSDEGLVFSLETRPTIATLLLKVKGDPRLSAGWWPNANDTDVCHAIGAIAHCCLDESGLVEVEALLLCLCRTPRALSEARIFEKQLCLSPEVSSATDDGSLVDPTALVPSILQSGIFKALALAAKVSVPAPPSLVTPPIAAVDVEGAAVAVAPETVLLTLNTPVDDAQVFEQSPSFIKLSSLLGASVTPAQMDWLCSLGCAPTLSTSFYPPSSRAIVGIKVVVTRAPIEMAEAPVVAEEGAEEKTENGEASPTSVAARKDRPVVNEEEQTSIAKYPSLVTPHGVAAQLCSGLALNMLQQDANKFSEFVTV